MQRQQKEEMEMINHERAEMLNKEKDAMALNLGR